MGLTFPILLKAKSLKNLKKFYDYLIGRIKATMYSDDGTLMVVSTITRWWMRKLLVKALQNSVTLIPSSLRRSGLLKKETRGHETEVECMEKSIQVLW